MHFEADISLYANSTPEIDLIPRSTNVIKSSVLLSKLRAAITSPEIVDKQTQIKIYCILQTIDS